MKVLVSTLILILLFPITTFAQSDPCVTAPGCRLFAASTPAASTEVQTYTLGLRFYVTAPGQIISEYVYRESTDSTGTTGRKIALYSNTGTLLGSKTVSSAESTGWNEITFTSPISVTAGTYVIAYTTLGDYAAVSGQFSSSFTNGSLGADNAHGNNGVYGAGSANALNFPTSTFSNTWYGNDVKFLATAPTATPTSAATSTPTVAPTDTPTPIPPTSTPTVAATATATPSYTSVPTNTSTPIGTSTPTPTGTPIPATSTPTVAATSTPAPTATQPAPTPDISGCTNPGSGPSGTDYTYISAKNSYEACLNSGAQFALQAGMATQEAIPTATPRPTNTPTATPTAIPTATDTGCTPDGSNNYRTCVISDINARSTVQIAWWQVVIALILLIPAIIIRR